MDTTVDSKKMREKAAELSEAVHTLNTNIQKLVEAAKEAQSLKDKAKAYDGQELVGEKKSGYTNTTVPKKYVTRYYAHVNNVTGNTGTASMRALTGAPKENAFLQITKILDFTDSDLPAVADCIEQGIDEIETTLAKAAHEKASKEDETDTNKADESEESTDTNVADTGTDNYTPSGGGSGGGGGGGGPTGGSPQYKKNDSSTKNKTPMNPKPKPYKNDEFTNTNKSKNDTNITFSNNSDTPTKTDTDNSKNTNTNKTNTTTDKSTKHTPSTGTDSDNPTPSASVVLGNSGSGNGKSSPNYTNGQSNSQIEVLGEDPTPNVEPGDLEDSIVNGINRVIPGIKTGEKVQSGSALIPGAAGVTAAAAAGLGSKALLDRSDNFMSISNDDDDDDEENNNHSHKDDENKKKENSDDKGWLYGMGVGLGAVGTAVAKKEHDKEKEEDYGIADDREPEPETLEDD